MREHIVNDIELTVINDRDGDQCGYSYHQRLVCADDGPDGASAFLDMATNYEGQRIRAGAAPATKEELVEAARRVREYYLESLEDMREVF